MLERLIKVSRSERRETAPVGEKDESKNERCEYQTQLLEQIAKEMGMKTGEIDEYDSWDGDKIPSPDASRFELKSERKYVSTNCLQIILDSQPSS